MKPVRTTVKRPQNSVSISSLNSTMIHILHIKKSWIVGLCLQYTTVSLFTRRRVLYMKTCSAARACTYGYERPVFSRYWHNYYINTVNNTHTAHTSYHVCRVTETAAFVHRQTNSVIRHASHAMLSHLSLHFINSGNTHYIKTFYFWVLRLWILAINTFYDTTGLRYEF
jgi:hypothetical protein